MGPARFLPEPEEGARAERGIEVDKVREDDAMDGCGELAIRACRVVIVLTKTEAALRAEVETDILSEVGRLTVSVLGDGLVEGRLGVPEAVVRGTSLLISAFPISSLSLSGLAEPLISPGLTSLFALSLAAVRSIVCLDGSELEECFPALANFSSSL